MRQQRQARQGLVKSEQYAVDQCSEQRRRIGFAADHDGQLPAEARLGADARHRACARMQRQHAMWDEARTKAQRHEIHDEVEVVSLENRFPPHSDIPQPGMKTFAGIGLPGDVKPAMAFQQVGKLGNWKRL